MIDTEESEYFFRISLLLLNVGSKTLRKKIQTLPTFRNFEDFLSSTKHVLYHLWHPKSCKCPPYPIPSRKRPRCWFTRGQQHLNRSQWDSLYRLQISLCSCRSSCSCECLDSSKEECLCAESVECCCIYHPIPGVDIEKLDITLAGTILRNSDLLDDSEKSIINNLVELRNEVHGHAHRASLSILEYNKFWILISNDIKTLASTCDDTGTFELEIVGDIKYVQSAVLDASNTKRILTFWEECTRHVKGIEENQLILIEEQTHIKEQQTQMDRRIDILHTTVSRDTVSHTQHATDMREMKENIEEISRQCFAKHKQLPCKNLITNSKLVLEKHKRSALYVRQTDVFEEARVRLNANHVLILSGIGGRGKTSMAYELMVEMTKADSSYSPVIVTEPSQWDEVVDGQNHLVVLIDDICGKTNIDSNSLSSWEKRFEIMLSCASDGNVRLIIGIRSEILRKGESTFQNYDLFKTDNTLDLSSPAFDLNLNDKLEILEKYCKEKSVHVFQVSNMQSSHTGLAISQNDIYKIAQMDTLVGFPQLCKLFFSNQSFFRKGADFFLHASDELIREISSLRRLHPSIYSILCYTLLEDSVIDVENINHKLLNNIFVTLRTLPLDDADVRDTADQLSITYLDVSPFSRSVFRFKHVTIMEAVMKSVVRYYPEFVLSSADPKVLFVYFRSSQYRPSSEEICVTVQPKLDLTLAEKLLDKTTGNLQLIVQHPTFSDSKFLALFLDRAYEQNRINDILLCTCSLKHTVQSLQMFQAIIEAELRRLNIFNARRSPTKSLTRKSLYDAVVFTITSPQRKCDVFMSVMRLFDTYGIGINSQIYVEHSDQQYRIFQYISIILLAALSQRKDEVKYLISRDDINVSGADFNCNTLLHHVVLNGWFDLVDDVLAKDGSLLNRANKDNITPLLMAAKFKSESHEKITFQLLKHKATKSLKDSKGNSLLHYLALSDNLTLIDKLKDVLYFNDRNYEGETPLTFCLKQSLYVLNIEKFKILLQYSDSKSLCDKDGNTILHLLTGKLNIQSRDLMKYAIQKDSTIINKRNGNYETPVMLAAKLDDYVYIKELLDNR